MTRTETTSVWMTLLSSVVVVLAVGTIAFLFKRKMMPRLAKHTGKNMTVEETAYLGPNKALYLLKIGSGRYLAAGSKEGISAVVDVSKSFEATESTGSEKGNGGE